MVFAMVVDQNRRCPNDGHRMRHVLVLVAWQLERVYLCDCCGATLPWPEGH